MEDLGEEDVADERAVVVVVVVVVVCRGLEGHLYLQSTASLTIVDLEHLLRAVQWVCLHRRRSHYPTTITITTTRFSHRLCWL
jgi:hypothetical protein